MSAPAWAQSRSARYVLLAVWLIIVMVMLADLKSAGTIRWIQSGVYEELYSDLFQFGFIWGFASCFVLLLTLGLVRTKRDLVGVCQRVPEKEKPT